MTIHVEMYNIIIPKNILRNKYPGGFDQYLKDNIAYLGNIIWWDDHLLRYGSMDREDILERLRHLESLGFIITEERDDGKKYWVDVYAFGCLLKPDEPVSDPDWLCFSSTGCGVYMKGELNEGKQIGPTGPGPNMGSNKMHETIKNIIKAEKTKENISIIKALCLALIVLIGIILVYIRFILLR